MIISVYQISSPSSLRYFQTKQEAQFVSINSQEQIKEIICFKDENEIYHELTPKYFCNIQGQNTPREIKIGNDYLNITQLLSLEVGVYEAHLFSKISSNGLMHEIRQSTPEEYSDTECHVGDIRSGMRTFGLLLHRVDNGFILYAKGASLTLEKKTEPELEKQVTLSLSSSKGLNAQGLFSRQSASPAPQFSEYEETQTTYSHQSTEEHLWWADDPRGQPDFEGDLGPYWAPKPGLNNWRYMGDD